MFGIFGDLFVAGSLLAKGVNNFKSDLYDDAYRNAALANGHITYTDNHGITRLTEDGRPVIRVVESNRHDVIKDYYTHRLIVDLTAEEDKKYCERFNKRSKELAEKYNLRLYSNKTIAFSQCNNRMLPNLLNENVRKCDNGYEVRFGDEWYNTMKIDLLKWGNNWFYIDRVSKKILDFVELRYALEKENTPFYTTNKEIYFNYLEQMFGCTIFRESLGVGESNTINCVEEMINKNNFLIKEDGKIFYPETRPSKFKPSDDVSRLWINEIKMYDKYYLLNEYKQILDSSNDLEDLKSRYNDYVCKEKYIIDNRCNKIEGSDEKYFLF